MPGSVDLGLVRFAQEFVDEILKCTDLKAVEAMLAAAARALGFRHYAMIHHDDHRTRKPSLIFIQNYPEGYAARYVAECLHRHDPVVQKCHVINRSFAWSELGAPEPLTSQQRDFLERGAREGVSDGVTVPSYVLGERGGSCNFAGAVDPARVLSQRWIVQSIGSFAFQTARRISLGGALREVRAAGLTPRERECIIWSSHGKSNTDIGQIVGISAATVKDHLASAYRRLGVATRAQLPIAAVLDGEIGVHEILPQKYRWLGE